MTRLPDILRVVTLTATMNSTASDTLSVFKDGMLKPGIYKIQNLYTRNYMDIHEHSKEVCCRPATALEEGGGLVRPFSSNQWFAHLTSRSGRSSLLGLDTPYRGRAYRAYQVRDNVSNDEEPRSSRGGLSSFVFRYTCWETGLSRVSALPRILCPGGSWSLRMSRIVDLNMSG